MRLGARLYARGSVPIAVVAHHVRAVKFESILTCAHEAAECVAAPPILAHVLHLFTLVDILQDGCLRVGFEPVSTRTDHLVLLCALVRALFTVWSPRLGCAGAAAG